MKLLIIYHAGLAEDSKHIFEEYARQGIDVTVIVPKKNGSLVYHKSHDKKSFVYVPLKFRAGFSFLGLLFAIKRINPDVIHVIDEYTSISLLQTIICRNLLYGNKVPVFSLSFQNLPLNNPQLVFSSPVAFLRRVFHKLLIPFMIYYHKKNLAGVVCGNKDAINIIRGFGTNIPTKLIYWGVNLKTFIPKDRNDCRTKLNLPKNVKIIGYFGKIYKEKGLEKLVRAIERLTNWHLILVGSGDYKGELENLVSSLNIKTRVYFYDFVKLGELGDYYNALDAYVLPTYTTKDVKEQYGRVLVEAMSCRIPIIGSTCGAIEEVLEGYPAHVIFNEYELPDLIDKIKIAEELSIPESFNEKDFLRKFSVEHFVLENIKFYKNEN